jgi:DNA topoisomerase-3
MDVVVQCDPEGENIAHEVIAVARRAIEANSQSDSTDKRIHRARFSAITPKALRDAFADLKEPDAALSRSVDARQELDLRVGVAFTRLLTWKTVGLARKRFDPATRVVSYGPCQTPALSFCVDRARQIEQFRPNDYWKVKIEVSLPGSSEKLALKWTVPNEEAVEDTRNTGVRRGRGESATSSIENASSEQESAKQIVDSACAPEAYALVTNIENKHETISPPVGLNTVALLEAGSKAMGMSPKQVMNVAEKLYSAGFISYPRTETTKYDPNGFDIRSVLREHSNHELWGNSCSYLLRKKYSKSGRPPSRGRDFGDHPPITPLKAASRQEVGGGVAWRVYEFVTRNFLGSLHNELSFTRRVASLTLNNDSGESTPRGNFSVEHVAVDSLGFADCCRWVLNDIGASGRDGVQFEQGETLFVSTATMENSKTRSPKFLQEHELILLMDEHRIGTDASMAAHVNNIVDRGYVQLCDETGVPLRPPRPPRPGKKSPPRQIGRYMVPTALGIGLLDLFGQIEEESTKDVPAMLSKPTIRRQMEEEVKQIAIGKLDKNECLKRNLRWFQTRHEELSHTLSRDRISDFGYGLSRTRDTLRYWRRLGAFEPIVNASSSAPLQKRQRQGTQKGEERARNGHKHTRRGKSKGPRTK